MHVWVELTSGCHSDEKLGQPQRAGMFVMKKVGTPRRLDDETTTSTKGTCS